MPGLAARLGLYSETGLDNETGPAPGDWRAEANIWHERDQACTREAELAQGDQAR
jgi:hypothetical protein